MQIPPTTTLINMANALPVQGIKATPASAKGPQTAAAPPSPSAPPEARQQPSGRVAAHRGSIINILV